MALTAAQITTAFQNVLQRSPSSGELNSYQAANASGALSDSQVYTSIITSPEATQYVNPVVRFYQAAFGRVPDQAGLTAQVQGEEIAQISLKGIATGFTQSTEFTNRYGTDTSVSVAYLQSLYVNVLGRTGSSAEIQAWQTAVATPGSGYTSRADVLFGFAQSSEFTANSNSGVVSFLTGAAQGQNVYSGSLPTNPGGVTTTFALTANVDTIVGSTGNDVINGVIANNTATAGTESGTLTSADNINGGAGTDTLQLRVTGLGATTTTAPVIQAVEIINVSNIVAANSATLNLGSSSGYNTLASQSSVAASLTDFTNVAAGTAVGVDNAQGTVNYQISGAGSRTGNSDAITLNVSNGSGTAATAANVGLAATFNADGTAATADNSYEIANIKTTGNASNVALATGGANITNVVVTGNANAGTAGAIKGYGLTLTENAAFANLKVIDASGMTGTGGLNIATTLAQNVTFTGSGQNDRLLVTGGLANIDANDKFAFGGGTDTLALGTVTDEATAAGGNAAAIASINAATGLERIELTAANVTSLKANDFTSVNAFEFSGGGTSALAVTGVETVDTYTFSASHVGTDTFTGVAVGQTANLIETGGISLTGTTGAGNAGAVAGGSAIAFGANITTLTLNSTGTTANAIIGGTGQVGGNGNNGGNGGAAIDNNTSVQSVTISGDQDLTISGGNGGAAGGVNAGAASTNGFSGAVNVDASALTGKLNIQGSTGNDIIKLGIASTGATTFADGTAATGNLVRGGAGGDSITLNTGVDRLDYRVATDSVTSGNNANSVDTVTNFTAGQDKFIVATAVTAVKAVSVTGTAGTLDTDITTALANGGFGGNNNAAVVTITGGANAGTYGVVDTNGGNTYTAGTDLVVKLVGLTGTLAAGDFVTTV